MRPHNSWKPANRRSYDDTFSSIFSFSEISNHFWPNTSALTNLGPIKSSNVSLKYQEVLRLWNIFFPSWLRYNWCNCFIRYKQYFALTIKFRRAKNRGMTVSQIHSEFLIKSPWSLRFVYDFRALLILSSFLLFLKIYSFQLSVKLLPMVDDLCINFMTRINWF